MAHGLLEERLVQATEVAVDLVGNDTVVPDALLFGGHSTSHAMMMMSFHFPLRAAAVEDKNVDGCSCGHIECLMQQLLRANESEWERMQSFTGRMRYFNCQQFFGKTFLFMLFLLPALPETFRTRISIKIHNFSAAHTYNFLCGWECACVCACVCVCA